MRLSFLEYGISFHPMIHWILSYFVAGILVMIIHPRIRSTMTRAPERTMDGASMVIVFLVVLLFFLAFWPIHLISNTLMYSVRGPTLKEVKDHLKSKGRKINESDRVLEIYNQTIITRIEKVAAERGEKLHPSDIKEVAFHYMDMWVEANETKMGMALPFLLNDGMKTFRLKGIESLLKEVRGMSAEGDLSDTKNSETKTTSRSVLELAEAGDALFQLIHGARCITKDPSEGARWYRKAAEQGNASAQLRLGTCYANGNGVLKNAEEAAIWYRKAAEQGYASAQFELGLCYFTGTGVSLNANEAALWFQKAAENGNVKAQKALSYMYTIGNGVPADIDKAVNWELKAAELGDVVAQVMHGNRYKTGLGVIENDVEAARWFRKAADKGCAVAQKIMGSCYEIGEGVERNQEEAKRWFAKAAEKRDDSLAEEALLAQFQLVIKRGSKVQRIADQK